MSINKRTSVPNLASFRYAEVLLVGGTQRYRTLHQRHQHHNLQRNDDVFHYHFCVGADKNGTAKRKRYGKGWKRNTEIL